jgi:protocatechuate 3,4-dioxygenase beta subunit
MQIRVTDENTITEAALDQMSTTKDPRLKEIMDSLVRHLHAFAREVDLKPEEWLEGIKFLSAVGQWCSPIRQEFILLSDTLGLSSLVNSMHDRRVADGGTTSSLLGPFFRQGAPNFELGQSIATHQHGGIEIGLYGRITDTEGRGIPNASIEIWQTDESGVYDMQKNAPDDMDMRGVFHSDAHGNYHLRTVRPCGYMIPMDGPVGDMIRAQGRHGYRPAHIHFMIGAPGYRELATALYLATDDHISSDTVFGVRHALVTETAAPDPSSPFPDLPCIRFDYALGKAEQTSGRVGADPSQFAQKAVSH